MPAEQVQLPLTGFGDSTATVAVDSTPEGVVELVKLAVSTDGSSSLIPGDSNGLVVQPRLDNPQTQQLIATSVGPGGLTNLDATDIPAGKSGKLLGADLGSSVPFRWDIQTVSGSRTTRTTIYTQAGKSFPFRPPLGEKWISLTGGSGIHFGVGCTNLSVRDTADARVTLYWDEQ